MKKESIKDILLSGGTIEIPYKTEINEWYSQLRISKLNSGGYVIQPRWQKFSDIDDAINWFLNEGFTSNNKGYIQNRLISKGSLNSDSDIENLNDEIIKIFEIEGNIVDQEAKLLDIIIKPFAKEEDAFNDIELMVDNLTVDNLRDSLSLFESKYMSLDPYINISFVYDTKSNGENHEFSSGVDYKSFSEKMYLEYNNINKNCIYKYMQLTIKIYNSDYKRYILNL